MRQHKRIEESSKTSPLESQSPAVSRPIIASIRSGLAGTDDALMRRIPSNYSEKTVGDVLGYAVESETKTGEAGLVKSLKNELGAAGSVITINGRNAKLTDSIAQYLTDKSEEINGKTVQWRELEMEVSAIQQGGFYSYI